MLVIMPEPSEQVASIQNSQVQSTRTPIQHQKAKKRVNFNKLMLSTYFRIAFTFLLMILLFMTASFIAFQSEQKRKALQEYEVQIPDAEIIVPETQNLTPTRGVTLGEGCVVSGCNNELCQNVGEEPTNSICLYKPEYVCYQTATCEKQDDGNCGWIETENLTTCFAENQENDQ